MNNLKIKFESESGNEITEMTKNKVTKAIYTLFHVLKEKPLNFVDDVDYDSPEYMTVDDTDLKSMLEFDPVASLSVFEDWEGNETIEVHVGFLMFLIKTKEDTDYLIIGDREILLR